MPAASLTCAVSELLPLLERDVGAPAAVALHHGGAELRWLPSRMVTVAPASAHVDRAGNGLARLVGRPARAADRHHRCGGVEREAERGGAGIAEAVGLARHDGVGAVGQPARGERPGAVAQSAVTVVAMALPSMVKCTTVLASPVPLSASFEVMWSLDEVPVSMLSASVRSAPVVLSVKVTALWCRCCRRHR